MTRLSRKHRFDYSVSLPMLPFAGFLVAEGRFTMAGVIAISSTGNW